jgi:hypothetical protein
LVCANAAVPSPNDVMLIVDSIAARTARFANFIFLSPV